MEFEEDLENNQVKRDRWVEIAGYLVLSIGLLLVISVYTYDPTDYTRTNISSWQYNNLGRSHWSHACSFHHGELRIAGLVWPAFVTIWGALLQFLDFQGI